MKKLLIGMLFFVLCAQLVAADIYITEVMHSPSQTSSHSDGEWVEIYNSGSETVNLSDWTLDGNEFEDVEIESEEYLVIARELLDGDDADEESFESYWGDNNGIWDENFKAVDGSMSLSAEDCVSLSSTDYNEEVCYNSSYGGSSGRTIERLNLDEWQESDVDGNPGSGSFSLVSESVEEESEDGEISLHLTVSNSVPEVILVNISTDDSSAEGVQVMPNVDLDKDVDVEVFVLDGNGYSDIEEVSLFVNNESYNLSFLESVNESVSKFTGTFAMRSFDLAGDYVVDVEVSDGSSFGYGNASFEYLGILSTRLNVSSVYFDMGPGDESEYYIEIVNSGNVLVDTEIYGEEFVSEEESISLDYLELYNGGWYSLETAVSLDLDLEPNVSEELRFRLIVPYSVSAGNYEGSIVINSMESG